ncbi:nucleotide-binding-oligomerization-domain like receptor [Pyrrhoderma noxium]|uniref:Nucleotide-binding-oligomerization-domain like receptor n=1 Tax=Pyrrhoderma noxium TaxID=2282107 RepID=A0A286U5L6_9AGAM|nr:nucleotide-binding-oligomerization-domain like receptor [Pyrrhoderma noxium]
MPITQNGLYSSANIETYNDYGNITNVYNESDSNKLKRLKDILRPLSVTDREANRPKCLKGTCIDLLQQIRTWAQSSDLPNIFVLTGGAGTGKSTISRTIAEEFEVSESLGCYIFFERGKMDSASITNTVIKTIAYHLTCNSSDIAESLLEATKDLHELRFPSTETLFQKLLYKPLHSISISHISNPILVVLDALDECGDSEAQENLANLLKYETQTLPSNIRFLVTSRPEGGIIPLLSSASLQSRICEYVKLNHTSESSKKEVVYYIRHELEKLRDENRIIVKGNWEWDENIDRLGCAAEGLFIWASTAIRFINEVKAGRFNRLQKLVNDTKGVGMNLDMLYATVLENCIDWKDDEMKEVFSSVFSLILFGKTPLSDVDIDEILDYEEGTTMDILSGLHSLVVFEAGQPIRIHHTSLHDYLTSMRCDESWYINSDVEMNKIASRCFVLTKSRLHFNICDIETSFKFNKDIPNLQEHVDKRIHPRLLYACRYWASHLRGVPYSSKILSELDNFMYKQLLYWIEVLSLTGSLYECFEPVLESAIGWAEVSDQTSVQTQKLTRVQNNERHVPFELLSFLEDALHHVFEFIQPISESTPHLYMTFLPLKRSESDVARHYLKNMEEPTRIEYIGDRLKATLGCTKKFDVGSSVSSISLSYHGNRILSRSPFGLSLWNADSGELLRGPFGGDASVSFSYFSNRTVVVNQNGAVDEWDTDTGEKLHDLPRVYNGHVTSVAVDDRQYYATGFEDGAIQLWSRWEGTMIGEPMRGHSKKVLALSFSGLGHCYLASGSEDQSIIVWDVKSGEKKYAPLKGHSGPITSLTFTYWSKSIVSGSLDGTVHLWDVVSGEMLHAFSASGMGGVYSVAYCGKRHILSGSEDGIIRIWDILNNEVPPKNGIYFASGSSDGTIRVWDVDREYTIVKGQIQGAAVSPSGEYLVSVFNTQAVSIWRTETGELIKGPLKRYGIVGFVLARRNPFCIRFKLQNLTAVCFSPDGKRVASSSGNAIRVWDSKSGKLALNPIEGHSERVISICYSPNGKKIVSGSSDKIIRIWDASNGTLLLTLQGHSDWIASVTYSHNSAFILSGSNDGTIRTWDANTGRPVRELIKAHKHGTSTRELLFKANVSSFVISVVLLPSSDSKYIKFASASLDGLIRIWDVDVGLEERTWNTPNRDGWVIGNNGNLLSWIPSDIRPTLIGGPCIRILNSRFSTILELSKYQGSHWTSCFPSSTII